MMFYPLLVPDTGMSEDCLYLDIYTPATSGSKAVMVFIHGGGFFIGASTTLINGTTLAAHEDIVLVSINYRLGALGKS